MNLPINTKPRPGNVYLDGILEGWRWDVDATAGTIDYSLMGPEAESFDDPYSNIATSPKNWASYEIAALEQAFRTWEDVAHLKFKRVDDNDSYATLRFYLVDDSQLGTTLGTVDGWETVYFNRDGTGWNRGGLRQGGYGFITLIHEVGHALGLAHPHDNGGGSSLYPGAGNGGTGTNGLNQGVWTTMSYNDGLVSNGLSVSNFGYQGTPMAFDIAAIQHLYGSSLKANRQTIGNDVYELPTENKIGTFYASIWDKGGEDTITAEGARVDANIDLREASLTEGDANAGGYISAVNSIFGGYTIANGVQIENAIGGSGNDNLIGNDANNNLDGKDGDDFLSGLDGNNILDGGNGKDTVVGGVDADQIYGGDGDDLVYDLDGNDTMDGGSGNDSIYGHTGHDTINGRAGNDQLHGGDGSDTIHGWSDDDEIHGEDGDDVVYGGNGEDSIYGEGKDDLLYGWRGNDKLWGGVGNDTLDGENDNDELIGDKGDDVLNGGNGSDTLTGSNPSESNSGFDETDILTGGSGGDTFVLGDSSQAYYNGDGTDGLAAITDFNSAEGDQFIVHGSLNDYSLTALGSGLGIFFQADLIAFVQNTTNVVASDDFIFV